MSALAVMDSEIQAAMLADGIRYAFTTYARLLTRANPDGEVSVPIEWVQEATGLQRRQQLNHYRVLEEKGYIQRIDGGYRGRTLVIVVKRFVKDASAFIARAAKRAIYLKRRLRWQEIAARKRTAREATLRGRGMGATECTPLISIDGEQASASAAGPAPHTFMQGELLGICGQCEFPEANARHRSSSTRRSQAAPRSAWTNARFA